MWKVLLFAFALAGCAQGNSRQAVLNGLIGQPEAEAVRQLGVPTRTYATGGRGFLSWSLRGNAC